MYGVVKELFGSFMDNPKMVQTARKANAALRYRFTNPTVMVTIDSRTDPLTIEYGDTDTNPDVTITMTWDDAHQFLMGKANAAELFMKKRISIQPMSQATKYIRLVPMFLGLLKRYPEIIEERGLAGRLG